jgi:FAD-dependent oxidoreductase domain-containing protein 1
VSPTADAVIIGGGIVGASIAYHLAEGGLPGRVLVIDSDTTYARATTPASMGGVRHQYSVASNIAMARHGLDFYARFDEIMAGAWGTPKAHFHRRGYLLLVHETIQMALRQRYEVQRGLGVEIELLSAEDVHRLVPQLHAHECLGGLYTPRDGYLNPRGALQGFVERSRELGCAWLQDDVTGLAPGARASTVQTRRGAAITAPVVVLAAGPWTAHVAALAGIELPVLPVRRQACYVTLPGLREPKLPLILDRVNDIAFRSDTETDDHLLVSRTVRAESPGFNFDWDVEAFDTHIAPLLRRYLPGSGVPRLQRGWAGHYDVTPDENPILGRHPEHPGLFLATGFSGHGLMLAPAVGKLLSELIRCGRSETFDVHPYRFERFADGDLIVDPQI